MDAIRVSKVENVVLEQSGSISKGTIHLTAHHIIFRHAEAEEKELWMPYPLISLVNRLPQTLQGQSQINFSTRTFESFSFTFRKDSEATDVFESVKELTVTPSVTHLYAFFYNPTPPFPTSDGWTLYSPLDEYRRMGVGIRSKAWRFTVLNNDYSFCPTYPSRIVVPKRISDTTLQYAAKYRSKCRIPILAYLHWANFGSITRSSQPMVGITQNRSVQDEKLIEAIFQSHWSSDNRALNAVYGATATNLIIDARPTVNAVANTAKGAGTENMDYYKEGKKIYLGIDHIHAMRESLAKVVEALRDADQLLASINNDLPDRVTGLAVLDKQALRRSGWLRHISVILEGTVVITKNIHINSSHVLIHCSDGWDRTSQLSALSQLCLDPFYRTIRGFEILIEKDWLSFGHKFLDRCGHLSSDKFFLSPIGEASGADAAQAFLASMQNRFTSQNHLKETSPVFHQFLESVRQIQRQYPDRFEFNERFLRQLYYHLYSCQFGTFIFNCEKDRKVGDGNPPPCERTISVWDYFNSPSEMTQNLNASYNPTLDEPTRRTVDADMGVLFPNPKDVRFWHEMYGREDEEMNVKYVLSQAQGDAELSGPLDSSDIDPIVATDVLQGLTSRSIFQEKLSESLPVPRNSEKKFNPNTRDLASSLPELSSPRPNRSHNSSPGFSTSRMLSSPSNASVSPIWSRTAPELLSGGGVKSVWGKLSSNASAAFSVVQDAYAGVAKDLLNSGQGEESFGKGSELRGRETLNAWGEDRPASAQSSSRLAAPANSSNPWSTPQHQQNLSIFEENPWGPLSEPLFTTTTTSASTLPMSPTSPLPLDPTVAPILETNRKTSGSKFSVKAQTSLPETPQLTRSVTPPKIVTVNTDPLGVGPL